MPKYPNHHRKIKRRSNFFSRYADNGDNRRQSGAMVSSVSVFAQGTDKSYRVEEDNDDDNISGNYKRLQSYNNYRPEPVQVQVDEDSSSQNYETESQSSIYHRISQDSKTSSTDFNRDHNDRNDRFESSKIVAINSSSSSCSSGDNDCDMDDGEHDRFENNFPNFIKPNCRKMQFSCYNQKPVRANDDDDNHDDDHVLNIIDDASSPIQISVSSESMHENRNTNRNKSIIGKQFDKMLTKLDRIAKRFTPESNDCLSNNNLFEILRKIINRARRNNLYFVHKQTLSLETNVGNNNCRFDRFLRAQVCDIFRDVHRVGRVQIGCRVKPDEKPEIGYEIGLTPKLNCIADGERITAFDPKLYDEKKNEPLPAGQNFVLIFDRLPASIVALRAEMSVRIYPEWKIKYLRDGINLHGIVYAFTLLNVYNISIES